MLVSLRPRDYLSQKMLRILNKLNECSSPQLSLPGTQSILIQIEIWEEDHPSPLFIRIVREEIIRIEVLGITSLVT